MGTARHDLRWRQFSVSRSWENVREHPSSPEVLRRHRVRSFPEEHGDQGRADLLAGFQGQMGEFLAGRNAQTTIRVTHERTRPLPRPPESKKYSAARHLQIVVGKGGVGWSAAERSELIGGLYLEGLPEGFETVGHTPVAFGTMKDEFTVLTSLEDEIQSLNVLYDWCVFLARVLEVHRPFDRLEILILNAHAAHLQPRRRVGPNDAPLRTVVVELARSSLRLPLWQQLLRRFASI